MESVSNCYNCSVIYLIAIYQMRKIIIISDHWEWCGELLLGVSPPLDESLTGICIHYNCQYDIIISNRMAYILYRDDKIF